MKLQISVLLLGALVAVNAQVCTINTPFFGMLPPHYKYEKMTGIYSFPSIFVIVMFRKREN